MRLKQGSGTVSGKGGVLIDMPGETAYDRVLESWNRKGEGGAARTMDDQEEDKGEDDLENRDFQA